MLFLETLFCWSNVKDSSFHSFLNTYHCCSQSFRPHKHLWLCLGDFHPSLQEQKADCHGWLLALHSSAMSYLSVCFIAFWCLLCLQSSLISARCLLRYYTVLSSSNTWIAELLFQSAWAGRGDLLWAGVDHYGLSLSVEFALDMILFFLFFFFNPVSYTESLW